MRRWTNFDLPLNLAESITGFALDLNYGDHYEELFFPNKRHGRLQSLFS